MTGLFSSADEIYSERAAICEFDGLITREQAEAQGMLESQRYRESCEARDVVQTYYPDSVKLQLYLAKVLTQRGEKATNKLRADCRLAWKDKRVEAAK